MVNTKIYIEGGGEGKYLEICFQKAWTKFFKAAGLEGRMPRPVRGKGRKNAYDLFCTALAHARKGETPLLLVDSEATVQPDHSVWQHLKVRDNWDKPPKADDRHAYLMAQTMETWLLADPEALQIYFGNDFKPDKIPAWLELEKVAKADVFAALVRAAVACKEKSYAKGKISFEILSAVSPQKVAEKCPQAKRLLDFLKA